MATSVGLNIITGRTGTAHVASDDDAAIWRGLVGNDNVVLFTDQKLALTDNGKQDNVGSLTIANGVFSIKNGHMGRVDNTATVTYALPNEGSYRRTLVIIRYAKVGTIESMTLMTLQSAIANDTTSASSAATLPVSTVPSTDYILYDFVCGSDGIINNTFQTKLTVIDTIPLLRAALNSEANTRATEDTALETRIGTLETYKNTSNARIDTLEGWKQEKIASDNQISTRVSTLEAWKTSQSGYRLVRLTPPSSTREFYNSTVIIIPGAIPGVSDAITGAIPQFTSLHGFNGFIIYELWNRNTGISCTFYKFAVNAFGRDGFGIEELEGGSAEIIGYIKGI